MSVTTMQSGIYSIPIPSPADNAALLGQAGDEADKASRYLQDICRRDQQSSSSRSASTRQITRRNKFPAGLRCDNTRLFSHRLVISTANNWEIHLPVCVCSCSPAWCNAQQKEQSANGESLQHDTSAFFHLTG